MGIFLTLLGLPLTGPLQGVAWVAAQVAEQAERELNDPAIVRQKLEELELRREMGQIDEDVYQAGEDALLARLAAIRARTVEEL